MSPSPLGQLASSLLAISVINLSKKGTFDFLKLFFFQFHGKVHVNASLMSTLRAMLDFDQRRRKSGTVALFSKRYTLAPSMSGECGLRSAGTLGVSSDRHQRPER